MSPPKTTNPFYVLLILVGIAFAITACAYGVMTVRGLDPAAGLNDGEAGGKLLAFLDDHGFTLMIVELALLAVLTFGAIATDEFWARRAAKRSDPESTETTEGPRDGDEVA